MSTDPSPRLRLPGRIPLWPLLPVLLLLGFALLGERGVLRTFQSGRQKAVLEAEIRRLEEANAVLRREIEALRADRRHLETIARRELGMVREDELIYQFRSDGRQREAEAPPAKPAPGR